jgi:hypothetical protein
MILSVRPSKPMGFGTQLIQRAFEFELDGTTELTFAPEGASRRAFGSLGLF